MGQQTITILGGSGFVGSHLIARLAAAGHTLVVPCRHPQRVGHLKVFPTLRLLKCDIHRQPELNAAVAGSDVVINLVGILNETRQPNMTFEQNHVALVHKVVEACRQNGVTRLLQMSALHADPAYGSSRYLRSKGEGENIAHAAHGLTTTSLRPSVIFGPGDRFFNRFAALLHQLPGPFPLACPDARFAPIYVGDVAEAFAVALESVATHGQRLDLCGPNQYTLRQLVDYTARHCGVDKRVIGLSDGLSRLQARLLEWVPGKPFSRDNYLSLQTPSVCAKPFPPLLGFTPTALETIVPGYLGDGGQRRRYPAFRQRAHR